MDLMLFCSDPVVEPNRKHGIGLTIIILIGLSISTSLGGSILSSCFKFKLILMRCKAQKISKSTAQKPKVS